MYFLKTCKEPFNHLEFNCGARLTNCVSKFLWSGFNGWVRKHYALHNVAIISINPALLQNYIQHISFMIFPLTLQSWLASLTIVCS